MSASLLASLDSSSSSTSPARLAAVDVGQSTVSAHQKVLADVRFVLADHRGTAAYYRINEACVDCFPTAADIVTGKPAIPPVPAPSA